MKERVKNILNYKKPTVWIVIAAVLICGITAACFMTKQKEDKSEKKVSQEKPVNAEASTEPSAEPQESASPVQYYFGNAIESAFLDVDKTKKSISELKELDFLEAKEVGEYPASMIYIKEIEELGIKTYYYQGEDESAFLLKIGEQCEVFFTRWNIIQEWNAIEEGKPSVSCYDYDGDGEPEIAMALLNEIGTGIKYEKLYVFDKQPDGHYQIYMYDETCYEKDVFPGILSWYAGQGADFVLESMNNFDTFKRYYYTAGEQYSMYLNETVLFELQQTGQIIATYGTHINVWAGSLNDTSSHEREFKAQVFYEGNGKFSARLM